MFSAECRFMGGHGIVGGQAPLAIGIAHKINYRNENDLVVCYLGDAAMNQGQVMEAMNMAVVWKLPVLFIIENNRYGMGTDIKRTTGIAKLADRANGFGMDSGQVDGMDVIAVYQKTQEVAAVVREQKKPYLLEAMTYRYRGHSVSDPGSYRTKEELEHYRSADPLLKLGHELTKQKVLPTADLDAIASETKERMRKIEKFADESEKLPVSAIYEDVYAPEGR